MAIWAPPYLAIHSDQAPQAIPITQPKPCARRLQPRRPKHLPHPHYYLHKLTGLAISLACWSMPPAPAAPAPSTPACAGAPASKLGPRSGGGAVVLALPVTWPEAEGGATSAPEGSEVGKPVARGSVMLAVPAVGTGVSVGWDMSVGDGEMGGWGCGWRMDGWGCR